MSARSLSGRLGPPGEEPPALGSRPQAPSTGTTPTSRKSLTLRVAVVDELLRADAGDGDHQTERGGEAVARRRRGDADDDARDESDGAVLQALLSREGPVRIGRRSTAVRRCGLADVLRVLYPLKGAPARHRLPDPGLPGRLPARPPPAGHGVAR